MDDKIFKEFLLTAQQHCLPRLNRLTSSQADSEDAFMEAAFQFWKDIQAGKIKDDRNLKGLIFVMAKNIYLGKKRKQNRGSLKEYSTDPQLLQIHEGVSLKDSSESSFNPMIKQEEEMEALMANQVRKKAFSKAMKSLEKKCREILLKFIGHNVRLKELQQTMGFASPDAVKTAKYRCKKKLVNLFKQELTSVAN